MRRWRVGGGSPINTQLEHGVLQVADWFPARAGSWDLFWWHNMGLLHAIP